MTLFKMTSGETGCRGGSFSQGVLRRRGMLLREKVFYFVSVMLALNYSLKFK